MNLYSLFSKPKSLKHYALVSETNPDIFWEKYKNDPIELKKREKYFAKDAEFAYWYAQGVLKGPFSTGEKAIAKSSYYSYLYARHVLKGPFPAGEATIATDAETAHWYAKDVLKKDFYLDGKLITKYVP